MLRIERILKPFAYNCFIKSKDMIAPNCYVPIDRMIVRLFAGMAIFSILIIFFQHANSTICADTSIFTTRNSFHKGEVITFQAQNKSNNTADNKFYWEFGDSYAATGKQAYHSYNKTGKYKVQLFYGKCSWNKEIIIKPDLIKVVKEPVPEIFPTIEGPATVFAGKIVRYTNTSANARSWLWTVIQDDGITYNQPSIKLAFQTPGEKILSLIVNNDSAHMVTKHITVLNQPVEAPQLQPPKKQDTPVFTNKISEKKDKVPDISESEFRYLLATISNRQGTINDLLPYLCSPSVKVLINGNTADDITHFCRMIYGRKKLLIDQLNLVKDENGCVKEILLYYNKKKILGLF